MTLILAKFWPYLVGLFVIVCAFVNGAFAKQKVKAAKADAATSDARAAASKEEAANARADALIAQKAALASQSAAADREKADAGVETLGKTPGAITQAMENEGFTK